MKNIQRLSLLVMVIISSCQQKAASTKEIPAKDSFLPMQIGNKWSNDAQNYTEIQDTLRIDKNLYYKFYSLIGGDATAIKYLRIDENNQLLEAFPNDPGHVYLHAKFNANVNDVFYTLNDKTENDYQVKLIEKTDDKRTFELDMVYHPNLKGDKQRITYIKGLGQDDNWKNIRINGVEVR